MPAYTKNTKISIAELTCGSCGICILVMWQFYNNSFRCLKCKKPFLVNDIFEIKRIENATKK